LIDRGSSLNLFFYKIFLKMGLKMFDLQASDAPYYRVISRYSAHPLSHINLPVTFGTKENYRTEVLRFEVADDNLAFHALIGRPGLTKFMAVPHYAYLVLKMSAPNGILSIRADLRNRYSCAQENVLLAKVGQ
jgi:hypothetical protein